MVPRAFEGGEERESRRVGVATCLFVVTMAAAAAAWQPAAAATLEVLHEFTGVPDGSDPMGGLVVDPNTGTLYGTATYGGANFGTVFALSPPPPDKHKWKYETIYTFQGGSDGANPTTGLAINSDLRFLYGTTLSGSRQCSCGTIFKLYLDDLLGGKGLVHEFSGETYDGSVPNSAIFLRGQRLYGTTGSIGGSTGTIYQYDEYQQIFTVIYNPAIPKGDFVGTRPQGVVVDDNGTIFGTAYDGAYFGTVFRMDIQGKGKILYGFQGPPDGAYPQAPPIMDSLGTLYGTTPRGGKADDCPNSQGCGTVWKLHGTREKVLHSFKFFTKNKDGMVPISPLVRDEASGTLYGATYYGGTGTQCGGVAGSCGTIFRIDSSGNYDVLWEFPKGGPANPQGQLVFYGGALYGVSYDGGKPCLDQHYIGCGTVWKLTP